VWRAATTTAQDRKDILRLVIERVEVPVHDTLGDPAGDHPLGRWARQNLRCGVG